VGQISLERELWTVANSENPNSLGWTDPILQDLKGSDRDVRIYPHLRMRIAALVDDNTNARTACTVWRTRILTYKGH